MIRRESQPILLPSSWVRVRRGRELVALDLQPVRPIRLRCGACGCVVVLQPWGLFCDQCGSRLRSL